MIFVFIAGLELISEEFEGVPRVGSELGNEILWALHGLLVDSVGC